MSASQAHTIAGAAVAALAGLSYLDARLNLRWDINYLLSFRKAFGAVTKADRKGETSLYYLFEDAAKQNGDTEAIWSRGECLTYDQAYKRVHQYAQWFLSQGVAPGDLVVFYMVNSPDFICAWLGLLAIGSAPALVNTNLASNALIHCVKIAKARLVLADGDEQMLQQLDGVQPDLQATGHQIVKLKDVRQRIAGLEPTRPSDELRKTVTVLSPLALAYTSGTTGLPKAISFPMLVGHAFTVTKKQGYAPVKGRGQRCYDCMPYYHMTGGLSAMQVVGNGDTLCIAPKFRARTFWADVRDSRATYLIYVGEVIRYLLAQPPSTDHDERDHHVHTIIGNGLRADIWEPFRARFGIQTIHEFYNSTEMMLGLANTNRGDFTAHALGLHGALMRWLTRGRYAAAAVDPETGHLIRDPATGFIRRCSLEEGGEILVHVEPGSAVPGRDFRGYYGDEDATGRKIARDVFQKGDCWYRTGDALRRDSEGRWFFNDRLGDTFRWKGENVSTTEVANALGEFPGVVEANVYGVQLSGYEGRAGAVALLVEEGKRTSFDFGEFLRYCRSRLPKYAVPVFVRLTSAPYSTGNHKQNKVPLKTEGVDPEKVSNNDSIYWIARDGKGDSYIPFTMEDWKTVEAGRARL